MRSHMYHKLARLDKCFAAHRTFVGSLACVNSHVPMQLAAVLERPAAHVALVRPLLRVDAPMDLKILLNTKRFVTKFTFKRPFAGVGSIVSNQSCGYSKSFLASIALVGIGSCGCRHLATTAAAGRHYWISGWREIIVLLHMRLHVTRVRTFAAKNHVTLFTFELHLGTCILWTTSTTVSITITTGALRVCHPDVLDVLGLNFNIM